MLFWLAETFQGHRWNGVIARGVHVGRLVPRANRGPVVGDQRSRSYVCVDGHHVVGVGGRGNRRVAEVLAAPKAAPAPKASRSTARVLLSVRWFLCEKWSTVTPVSTTECQSRGCRRRRHAAWTLLLPLVSQRPERWKIRRGIRGAWKVVRLRRYKGARACPQVSSSHREYAYLSIELALCLKGSMRLLFPGRSRARLCSTTAGRRRSSGRCGTAGLVPPSHRPAHAPAATRRAGISVGTPLCVRRAAAPALGHDGTLPELCSRSASASRAASRPVVRARLFFTQRDRALLTPRAKIRRGFF